MRQPRRAHQTLGILSVAALVWGASPAAAQTTRPSLFESVVQSAAAQAPSAAEPQEPAMQLSVDDAVSLALEHNLGIQVQRLSPQIQDMNVAAARANWTPTFTSSFSTRDATQIPTSTILPRSTTNLFSTGVGASQTLPWGGVVPGRLGRARGRRPPTSSTTSARSSRSTSP